MSWKDVPSLEGMIAKARADEERRRAFEAAQAKRPTKDFLTAANRMIERERGVDSIHEKQKELASLVRKDARYLAVLLNQKRVQTTTIQYSETVTTGKWLKQTGTKTHVLLEGWNIGSWREPRFTSSSPPFRCESVDEAGIGEKQAKRTVFITGDDRGHDVDSVTRTQLYLSRTGELERVTSQDGAIRPIVESEADGALIARNINFEEDPDRWGTEQLVKWRAHFTRIALSNLRG